MAATSASCHRFFPFRPDPVQARTRSGCGKMDNVGTWLITGIANAFFASLDRCSCIRVATVEDADDWNDDLPLISSDKNQRSDGVAVVAGRPRIVKGSKGGP